MIVPHECAGPDYYYYVPHRACLPLLSGNGVTVHVRYEGIHLCQQLTVRLLQFLGGGITGVLRILDRAETRAKGFGRGPVRRIELRHPGQPGYRGVQLFVRHLQVARQRLLVNKRFLEPLLGIDQRSTCRIIVIRLPVTQCGPEVGSSGDDDDAQAQEDITTTAVIY